MKTEPVVIEKVYNASLEKVWKAITDKEQMKLWYFQMDAFEPVVGFEFSFVGENEGRKYIHLCRITEVIPLRRLKHTWRYKGLEGLSYVTWELFAEGPDKTRVKLTHEGLETFPQDNADMAKKNFVGGWTEILGVMLSEHVQETVLRLSMEINASAEVLWRVLTDESLINIWAASFSEGAHVRSDWTKGGEVTWLDRNENVGARGKVIDLSKPKYLKIAFFNDPSDVSGIPGPYHETYTILPQAAGTVLDVQSGPLTVRDSKSHQPLWEKAIRSIKELSENGKVEVA